jgi:acetyl-CoA carboxylase biotin carboxyl carrier protein
VSADDAADTPRPFDVRTIRYLVRLMERHELSEIDLHEGELRIRLRRGAPVPNLPLTPVPAAAPAAHAPSAPPAPTPAAAATPPAERAGQFIRSELIGTFYARPKPDKPPYVTVGSRVTPETVVCQIEAMKIFNEVQAGCSGVIAKVLVENGQPVEFDTPLFEVDPS